MRKAQPANRKANRPMKLVVELAAERTAELEVERGNNPSTWVDASCDRVAGEWVESVSNHDDTWIKSGMKTPFGIRFSIAAKGRR